MPFHALHHGQGQGPTKIIPGYSIPEYRIQHQQQLAAAAAAASKHQYQQQQQRAVGSSSRSAAMTSRQNQPVYVELPPKFIPTWARPLPDEVQIRRQVPSNQPRKFILSLINVHEFTIAGAPIHEGYVDGPVSSLAGLRGVIKETSKDYGKATFEREGADGSGRWKIPLVRIICFSLLLLSPLTAHQPLKGPHDIFFSF